jgi:hypothetical protein
MSSEYSVVFSILFLGVWNVCKNAHWNIKYQYKYKMALPFMPVYKIASCKSIDNL